MFEYFLSRDQLRRRALKNARHKVMQKYLSVPFPNQNKCWDEVEIISLDFETSGLDPVHDQILSYGKIHIKHGLIKLESARHQLIQAKQYITESSAIIHHITDDQSSAGLTLEQALPELLDYLAGKIMLVHFNKIEQGFLDAACQALYGSPFIIPIIDTLKIAERLLTRRNHALQPSRLRLFNLREDFNLPIYKAHNALNDAMTTAELFLVLESEITPTGSTAIKSLL
jgi:DNA polymerase-3 subunit epsilon